ncbi:MAG TPA: 1,2-phenylacetyl-CoA epoxidase subunit PaaD [Candidatus Limnocylindria bacterium]|nr:1,2-phenylacetyl-CoA epoxidase subunit PaaD [Candidatus Limnocylindria bacterium]
MVARAAVRDPRELAVRAALDEIPDPEIPAISVVELGVIGEVAFEPRREGGELLSVELLPTFVGCPAIDVMRQQIGERLTALGVADEVQVRLTFAPPWTSDRISAEGREKLRGSGFAPPVLIGPSFDGHELQLYLAQATCPYCGSERTTLDNPFGPTLCRAIYHCDACNQPFEQFKAV